MENLKCKDSFDFSFDNIGLEDPFEEDDYTIQKECQYSTHIMIKLKYLRTNSFL
jgi:hypothetical protein